MVINRFIDSAGVFLVHSSHTALSRGRGKWSGGGGDGGEGTLQSLLFERPLSLLIPG